MMMQEVGKDLIASTPSQFDLCFSSSRREQDEQTAMIVRKSLRTHVAEAVGGRCAIATDVITFISLEKVKKTSAPQL
jgi:hypothetical protein